MTPTLLAEILRTRALAVAETPAPDREVFIQQAWLDSWLPDRAAEVESEVLPALDDLLMTQIRHHGWIMPAEERTVPDVLVAVDRAARKMTTPGSYSGNAYSGSPWLKAVFPSFWFVDRGPAHVVHDDKIREKVLRYRLGLNRRNETFNISFHKIRFGFVAGNHTVSHFKPATAAAIWRRWISDTDTPVVWDPSAGFGARMLGFFASFPGGKYICNEPATATRRDLGQLWARLQPHTDGQADVRAEGSEIRGPGEPVDLVFTSPPYFDREKYFDEPGQCWKDYSSLATWTDGYLRPTLRHAREALKPGGKVIINIHTPLREVVIKAAQQEGLTLRADEDLILQRCHMQRRHGATKPRGEPVLVFEASPVASPVAPRPPTRREDEELVRDCLALYAEGHLTIPTVARLLRCSLDVARGLVRNVSQVGGSRARSPRRSKARREEIRALIAQGASREAVNEALGETLNHQEYYYYRPKGR